MSAYRDVFLSESAEYLQGMTDGLLGLESDPADLEPVEVIFRGAHSLKGMAAAMGYVRTQELTHKMESLMDTVRSRAQVADRSLIDLMLRHIRVQGTASLRSLSNSMKLSVPVVESLFHQVRQQQFLDVGGMVGNDYLFKLTQKARDHVAEASNLGHYAGPVPVSIEEYNRATRAQMARPSISRARLNEVFSDLVIPDDLLDQVGPAVITHRSVFFYGPTGNGKTSIAERLVRIYTDTIVVPYALDVDRHIVTLFDPVVHRDVEMQDDTLDHGGWCAAGRASPLAANWFRRCWSSAWMPPPASMPRRCR
jgi:HPt (histidine-containing phosphotransfer) domain-containing protein